MASLYHNPITIKEALELIIDKGYKFECYTGIEFEPLMFGSYYRNAEKSYLGVTKGNSVWHWFEIEQGMEKWDSIERRGHRMSDESVFIIKYSHSYSQRNGVEYRKNADYMKTAANLLNLPEYLICK